jgi:cell division protease FtsH
VPNDNAPPTPPPEESRRRSFLVVMATILIGVWLLGELVLAPLASRADMAYSEFRQHLAAGQMVDVVIDKEQIIGTMKAPLPAVPGTPDTSMFIVSAPAGADAKLIEDLQKAGVKYAFARPSTPVINFLAIYVLPWVLLLGFFTLMSRRAGGGGVLGVGRSKAIVVKPEQVGVTFKDVGGADEAIAELAEIIGFLMAPQQFASLGGRLPKGVLLVGPPGTGKTLLARATAGEARVAFFETSGSEFVEMFVGVGAARVRDLFEQARQAAPAIIFIDEIDAIGQSRGGAMRLGGNEEREQTLNQLLAEIDGFKTDAKRPVIIMAATNRPEILDPALLRAGRFDRQIAVGNPDLVGRVQILKIHTRGVKLAPDFDLERVARLTPGFSGADLANVMNEAALLAARHKADYVTLDDVQAAIERVVAGLEQKTRVMSEQERKAVAYHESGHALLAELLPGADKVSKVSIIPRSRGSLGYTMQMPAQDRYLLTEAELLDRLAVMLGGRAAEKVVFDHLSTGASDDLQRATELTRAMVTEYGMSEKLGSVRYSGQQLRYLGGALDDNSMLSPQSRDTIDAEIRRVVTKQYQRAQTLLREHRAALDVLAEQLLEHETLEGSAVRDALSTTPMTDQRRSQPCRA